MRKCNCDNSVRYYFNFETENNFNIIMELCDGDLSQELSKKPEGFTIEEIKFIMSQLNNHVVSRLLKHHHLYRVVDRLFHQQQTRLYQRRIHYFRF